MKISTKTVYSILLKDIFTAPTAESKILRHGFTEENIHRIYELPFKLKNDVSITMFQYKVIHSILPTKVSFCRSKVCERDVCPQCFADRHSLDHMFLHCPSTINIWSCFQNWWNANAESSITLHCLSMILYGVFDNVKHIYSLNYALLIAKFTIYNSCLHDRKLCFDSTFSISQ